MNILIYTYFENAYIPSDQIKSNLIYIQHAECCAQRPTELDIL